MVRTLGPRGRAVDEGKRTRRSKATDMRRKSDRYSKPEPIEIYPKLDLRLVYHRNCTALGIKPNTRMLAELPEGLGSDDALTELNVANNYLGDRGCHAVIECIRLCGRLRAINFSNNGITDETVEMLAVVLQGHPAIEEVDLRDNLISQDSMAAVKRLLKGNPKITAFDLRGNVNIYESAAKDVEALLALNRGVQLHPPRVQQALRNVVLKMSHRPPHDVLARKLGLKAHLDGRLPHRTPPRNSDGWACVSVFVNATFSDFHTELHVLNHKIVPELNHRLRPYKIHLLPIDLHQSRQYGADNIENIRNVKYFMGSLRRCSDVYVSLGGEVLGWIPSPDEIPDYAMYAAMRAHEKTTPTSINLLAAREVLSMGGKKGDALTTPLSFFYFRHPSVLLDIPQHLLDKYCDRPPRKGMVKAERQALLQEAPPALTFNGYGAHFKSIDKFGQIHLCAMQDFEENLQADLFNAIEVMYDLSPSGRAKAAEETHRCHRVVVPRALSTSLRDAYFAYVLSIYSREDGASEPAAAVLAHILSAANTASPRAGVNIVVLTGDLGSGKTTSCAKLERELRRLAGGGGGGDRPIPPVLAYYPALSSLTPDACDIKTAMLNLYEQSLAIPGAIPYDDEAALVACCNLIDGVWHFWNHLSLLTARLGAPVVLILDAPSVITGLDHYLDFFVDAEGHSRVPKRVKLVISLSSPQHDAAIQALEALPNIATEVVRLDRLLIRERRALLRHMLEPYGEKLEPGEAKMIIDKKGSIHPLYCKLLAHDLLHKGRVLSRAQLIAQAPHDTVDLVVAMLKRREEREKGYGGAIYFTRIVSLLCAVRSGLTDLEAREILMKEFATYDTRKPQHCDPNGCHGSEGGGGAAAERAEDYLLCDSDGGYSSDARSAAKHAAEVRSMRKRLWGRWPAAPRLLPGSVWSRLLFELRPFVQRKVEQHGEEGLDTFVLGFTGEAVHAGAEAAYFTGRRRRARIHAQLGTFYRGKMFVKHRVLWEKGVRECVYHLGKAWLWDTLLEVLQPFFLCCVVEQGMMYEVARDLHAAVREVDACIDAHRDHDEDAGGEAHRREAVLREKKVALEQYRTFLLRFGQGRKATRTTLMAMLQAPLKTWRLAAQVREIHTRYGISYIAPSVDPFYAAREEAELAATPLQPLGKNGQPAEVDGLPVQAPSCTAGILTTKKYIITWITGSEDAKQDDAAVSPYRRLGYVFVWDLSGKLVRSLSTPATVGHATYTVTVSKDETQLLVANAAWVVQVWMLDSGDFVGDLALPALKGQVASIKGAIYYHEPAAKPTSKGPAAKSICLWDSSGRLLLFKNHDEAPTPANNTSNAVVDVDFSRGATKMVAAFEDCSSHVFSLTGRALGHVSSVVTGELATKVCFVAEATTHVLTFEARRVILWLADTGVTLQAVDTALLSPATSVVYAPDERLITTIDTDCSVKRFEVAMDTAKSAVKLELRSESEVGAHWKDDTLGAGTWTSNAQYAVGAMGNGVFTFLNLSAEEPSLAKCFVTSRALKEVDVSAAPPAVLPFCAMAALPTRPAEFAAVDATSGVPLVVEITSLQQHCRKLPQSSTMA